MTASQKTADSPTSRLVRVTPEIATEYLSRSDLNRTLSRDRAIQLAQAFLRGEHRLTGDAIVFSKRRLMTNGQHRCLAVIIAGSPGGYDFWVMEGADDDEQLVQDTGRPRSFTDHLRIRQVTNANLVSGATKFLWHYQRGIVADLTAWHKRVSPTVMQLDTFWDQNQELIRESLRHADRVRRNAPLNTSVLAVAWITLSTLDKDDAEAFWDQLTLKSDVIHSGVRQLLNQVSRHRQAAPGRTKSWISQYDARHQLALLFKAWNAWRDGREIENLAFKVGGKAPETFPVPH